MYDMLCILECDIMHTIVIRGVTRTVWQPGVVAPGAEEVGTGVRREDVEVGHLGQGRGRLVDAQNAQTRLVVGLVRLRHKQCAHVHDVAPPHDMVQTHDVERMVILDVVFVMC